MKEKMKDLRIEIFQVENGYVVREINNSIPMGTTRTWVAKQPYELADLIWELADKCEIKITKIPEGT